MKVQEEDTFKHYNYSEEILNYIRALVPNDMKSEILEDLYKVSPKEFCEALQITFCNVSLVVAFWKIFHIYNIFNNY